MICGILHHTNWWSSTQGTQTNSATMTSVRKVAEQMVLRIMVIIILVTITKNPKAWIMHWGCDIVSYKFHSICNVNFFIGNVRVVNTLRLRQNGRHFPGDIFKWIFLNETVWISIKISQKFVPDGPIKKIPALVQIMAWCRTGDRPSSERMMVVYWRIYAFLGLNELRHFVLSIRYLLWN